MANEGRITVNITFTKSNTTESKNLTDSFDVASAIYNKSRQTIGTADETLALGDVASLGFFVAKNCDATNFLELGHTSGTYSIKLKAGEICGFRVGSGMSAIHAKADTASCDLEYFVMSN